jgi:hypothetical protein
MVTIKEIEERIVELHRQGKTSKEISKDVHKNYNFIGDVLRKRFPEEYPDTVTMTKETQALKAFHAKKSPTEVAIELGLSTDETEKFYKNFWRLERLYELYRIYNENKSRLRLFLYFYKQLGKRKVASRKDFDDVLEIMDTNNEIHEEIRDFQTDFAPNILKRQEGERSLLRNDVYTLDELERAFPQDAEL